ncbi:MAG TPA: putative metal-dependent hydrolase [Longimicrobiales bacterium]|nr:putative metal-dependent hydrolase [Longimicrobiales bacterium]
METLKYPIGRFDPKAEAPASERPELIQSIAAAPRRLRAAVHGLSDQQLDTPYREGGWTVRQVVHHVPDSHLNAYIRFRWGMTEDSPMIKTYEEQLWAELGDSKAPIGMSLDLLSALHERWVTFIKTLQVSDFERTIQHPEWQRISLGTLLKLYEWHGRHHVAHITGLRERMGWS